MKNQTIWLKKLELNCFQKHKHLVIDFTNGVNVIVGETASGKTCVMRAICWFFFPFELKGDVIRREGTKKTSVKAWLSNGVVGERIKSDSVNRYIIGEGENKKEYNAIGKNLPKEVKDALGVNHIDIDDEKLILNISKQQALPFLLDKPGSFAMKLFNKMTGNDITDRVMQDYNKESLQLNRQGKSEEDNLDNYNKDLVDAKKVVNEKQSKLKQFKVVYDKIKAKEGIYNNLKEIYAKNHSLEKSIEDTTAKLSKCKKHLPDTLIIKSNIEKLIVLQEYQLKLGYNSKTIEETKAKLKSIKTPKINTKDLKEKCDVLNKIKKLKQELESLNINIKLETGELTGVIKIKKESEEKLIALKAKIGLCPWCRRKYE